jgi:2-desacetyl-2-hydroxyethyl bacteriochlorophyllide A dehydrogenase
MKALVYYGPEDLRLTEVADVAPAKNEVLVKIKACGICGSDVQGFLGVTGRRIPPMIMGHEFSGEIAGLGEGVKNFSAGDRVTVQPSDFCGECEYCKQGLTNMCTAKRFFGVLTVNGAFAQYLCVPEKLLYKLPDNISFEAGAMIEPFSVAYRAVEAAGEIAGKNILIVGAGTIGLLALKIAAVKKPAKIFVSDLNDFRLTVAKQNGADVVINPSRDNMERIIKTGTGEKGVDISIEAVGISQTVQQAMSMLRIGGKCVWIGNAAKMISINMQEVVTKELHIAGTYTYTHEQFGRALELLAKGIVNVGPIISRTISFEEAPEMFARLAKSPDDLLKVIVTD